MAKEGRFGESFNPDTTNRLNVLKSKEELPDEVRDVILF